MSRSKSKEIILWGASGHAKVLIECLKGSQFKVIALFDNDKTLESSFPNIPLFFGREGFEQWFASRNAESCPGFLVAIGGNKGRDRLEIQTYLESFGLQPLIAQHPTAFVAESAKVGSGSQILANASVCVDTVIGRGCIINTGAIVDHDCSIGDGVHVCPGAHIAGCVEVEEHVMIGVGAVVLPRVRIGRGAVVGAGAVVIENIPDHSVVVGNPAKPIRSLKIT